MTPIEEIHIERECLRLSNAFAYLIDRREYRALAQLFTEDGLFERDGIDMVGRKEIEESLATSQAFTRHVTTGHHFTLLNETAARAESVNRSYFAMPTGDPPFSLKPDQMLILDLTDLYRKTDFGWKIAERRARTVFVPDALRPMLGFEAKSPASSQQ